MNPLTNVKNLQKLNEKELELGIIGKKSWHDEYKDSAWIFTGGLPYDLTEGDIICVFSQYGEIVNINLVRDNKTGKSKGYAFICYQDQRSTVLSVDNLNGIKILGRTIRVDHVKDYKMPKEKGDEDEITMKLRQDGCAPKVESSEGEDVNDAEEMTSNLKRKKEKKRKKAKKEKKRKRRESSSSEGEESDSGKSGHEDRSQSRLSAKEERAHVKEEKPYIKEEKMDNGYNKALNRYSPKREDHGRHRPSYSDSKKDKRRQDYDKHRDRDSSRNGDRRR